MNTYTLSRLVAHGAWWAKESKVTVLAILLVIFDGVVVSLENGVTVDTGEAFGMPHLIKGGYQL